MSANWTVAEGPQQLEMMGAASRIIKTNQPVECPYDVERLRFYYHEFGNKPRRTGTIWVWCSQSKRWDHVSRVQLPQDYRYSDPFADLSLQEFDQLERSGFLDRLNEMWEKQEIPHSFDTTPG